MSTPNDLRYPIGPFVLSESIDRRQRRTSIDTIRDLPQELRTVTAGLEADQLNTQYRAGSWTVRQLVHHLADSHMNAYIRVRLALTEDRPIIKPYFEDRWAELPDAKEADTEVSLQLLEALHGRWTALWEIMTDEQFARTYRHPEMGEMRMDQVLALYAWHSRHHVAHISNLRARSGWLGRHVDLVVTL